MMCSRAICVSLAVAASSALLLVAASENLGFCFPPLLLLPLPPPLRFCPDDEEPSHPSRVPFCRLIVIALRDGKRSINVAECVSDGELDGVVFFYA